MSYEPGEIVLVPFPYTDLTSKKTRPALVLSSRGHNDASPDVVVCGLTSRLGNSSFAVLISPSDVQGKLPTRSRVKVSKLLTIHQRLVRKRLGRLKPAAMAQVWKEFQALFPSE